MIYHADTQTVAGTSAACTDRERLRSVVGKDYFIEFSLCGSTILVMDLPCPNQSKQRGCASSRAHIGLNGALCGWNGHGGKLRMGQGHAARCNLANNHKKPFGLISAGATISMISKDLDGC